MNVKQLFQKRTEYKSEVERLQDELLDKRSRMGTEILAGKDPSMIAAEIRDIESRIEVMAAAERTAELAAAEATKEQASEAEKERIEKLLKEEEKAYKTAVKALVELAEKLEGLDKVQKQISPLRGRLTGLTQSVKAELGRLRKRYPEMMGLPPLPTAEEVRKSEAENDVIRMRGVVAELKKQYGMPGGNDYIKRLVENAEAGLKAAEARAK